MDRKGYYIVYQKSTGILIKTYPVDKRRFAYSHAKRLDLQHKTMDYFVRFVEE